MNYRPDIDGLRGVAILCVLLFHAGLGVVPSGFIGVDVFFVISGFLITNLISPQNAAMGLKSQQPLFLIEFYKRRLWRLQPVWVSFILVTTLAACFYYLPQDLLIYAKSARKASLFFSNRFFDALTSGYFAPEANQMALLHTWSLSIEWQCYLLLPLLFYVLYAYCDPKRVHYVVWTSTLLCLMGSLALSHYSSHTTYYYLYARLFEFLIGASTALIPRLKLLNHHVANGLALLAFASIVATAMYPQVHDGFPNGYAVLVCGATAVLIALGLEHHTWVTAWLRFKPLVFIGLISYSVYLWHWPIFAFIRYEHMRQSNVLTGLALAIAVILGYVSWRFIEKPARTLNKLPLSTTLVCLVVVPILATHVSAYLIKKNQGYPVRFQEAMQIERFLESHYLPQRAACLEQKNTKISPQCVLGGSSRKKGLLIGDSFANQYWGFMDKLAQKESILITAHATVACLALPGIQQWGWFHPQRVYQECQQQTKRYYRMIQNNHYDYVFLGQNWNGYLGDKIINHPQDVRSIEKSRQRIERALDKALQLIIASKATPVLIKPLLLPKKGNPFDCFYEHIKLRKKYLPHQCDFTVKQTHHAWVDHIFALMQAKYPQLKTIDIPKLQCPKGQCAADIKGIPLFRDPGHINDYASSQWGMQFSWM